MNDFTALNPDCDVVLKIIIIGNSGVGKSALLKCFMGDPFETAYTTTIGVDFEIKPVVVDGKTVNLQLWDTAGQERFRTITTSYYRSTHAIMLVFDITDQESFSNLNSWLKDIRSFAKNNVDVILIGNKIDLEQRRVIDYQAAKEFADKNGMLYLETSAKQGTNVEMSFTRLTITAINNRKQANGERNDKEKQKKHVSLSPQESKDTSCC